MIVHIKPDIQKALDNHQAVVALESTIISHGMPYPTNVQMAKHVEGLIKSEGAFPATIAILNGIIKVGLTDDELETLAKSRDVLKVSKRDFGYVLSKGLSGATTVSATMLIAEMVGIKVFATGGIGGVHRGAEKTFDISRDLEELAQVNVCVVCAGAKSILDLSKTLEYLETKGVEVIGYQTEALPAFYTRSSKHKVTYTLNTPKEIADLIHAKWDIGLKGGIVVANPIPKEFSQDSTSINKAIDTAIEEANKRGITGKDTTPFLLDFIKNHTDGESLKANLELVYNNAKLAAKIAKQYENS